MRPNALAAAFALNVALAGTLVWLWLDGQRLHWAEPAALAPSLGDAVTVEAAEPPEVSRYRETLERPLFAATRKIAPKRDPAEPEAAADALKDVRLLGTYGAGSRGGIVVVRGGKVERLPVGSSIGGWKVAGEEGRGAALVNASGERRRLELALNMSAPAVAAATAAKAPDRDGAAPSAAAAEPARSADAVQAAPASSPSAPGAAPASAAAQRGTDVDAIRRERLERINERRAARGLPPITQ
jgi:hypothetical protein